MTDTITDTIDKLEKTIEKQISGDPLPHLQGAHARAGYENRCLKNISEEVQ